MFHQEFVPLLGFIIWQNNLQANPEKIQAVKAWPFPTIRKELQQFLEFDNFYRCFIPGFSEVLAPLTHLTFTKVDKVDHKNMKPNALSWIIEPNKTSSKYTTILHGSLPDMASQGTYVQGLTQKS